MTRMHARTRREALDTTVRTQTEKIFQSSDYQSILLVVSQFWNDGADDELHVKLIASRRSLPVWPHRCTYDIEPVYDDDGSEIPDPTIDDGEVCNWCAENIGYTSIGSTAETRAFETYCHEDANQEQSLAENYLPYAVGRRRADGGVDFEVIGVPQRPELEIEPVAGNGASWIADPRARTLYELVCAAPRDDGPRRVLADYLLEREHPHGELIALSLADALDGDTRARRDALIDEVGREWLGPLASVIPYESAVFERGFLARAVVAASSKSVAATRWHPAWGTVESIRIHRASTPLVSPAMVALREIGMLDHGYAQLFEAPRRWAIESLRIRVDEPAHLRQLAACRLLPQLRELVVGGKLRMDCLELPPVEKLAILDAEDFVPSPAQLQRWKTIAVAMEHDRDRAGWELAFSGEQVAIAMTGWHPGATLTWLAHRISQLPAYFAVELVASPYFAPVEADLARLRDGAARVITLRT